MNKFSSGSNKGTNQRLEIPSTEVSIIDAICINCNKRFKLIRAISMHLKITATRHTYYRGLSLNHNEIKFSPVFIVFIY